MKSTEKDRKLARIRARSSYRLFQRLHDFLSKKPSVPEILRKFHDVLDAKSAFGSRRNAECAAESLELVLRDSEVDGEPGEQKHPGEDEVPMISTARRIAPEESSGNFVLGDFFGDVTCRHGHPTRLFNIGRGHYVACDECKTYIFTGSNLMSCWRQENKDIWQANHESVKGYEFVE